MKRLILILTVLNTICFAGVALAQTNLTDAEVESRAKEIGRALRCVVCQNQSIDESDAELAADMRKLVRERIRAGDGNTDVMLYMQGRYGDYVLLRPPVQRNTLLLWFGPFLVLLILFIWYFKRSRRYFDPTENFTDEERAKIDALLKDGDPR